LNGGRYQHRKNKTDACRNPLRPSAPPAKGKKPPAFQMSVIRVERVGTDGFGRGRITVANKKAKAEPFCPRCKRQQKMQTAYATPVVTSKPAKIRASRASHSN
jgi:hypothetical protein